MAAIDYVNEMICRAKTSRLFFHLLLTEQRMYDLELNRKKDLLSSERFAAKYGYQLIVRNALYTELEKRFERIDLGALECMIESCTTFQIID